MTTHDKPRKGAVRLADVSPALRRALSRGEEPTRTVIEWMAIHMPTLVRCTLPDVGLRRETPRIAAAADAAEGLGIMERTRRIVDAIHEALPCGERGERVRRRLAEHPMDSVRNWACCLELKRANVSLKQHIAATRPFAADPHMAVREFAWMALRPHLSVDLERAFVLLMPWTKAEDAFIRRCAIESTRPRGVWCPHIVRLKEAPELGRALLDAVNADESLYVRKSVGNWINDAAKSRPDWVRQVAREWLAASPGPRTRWIVKHGLRSLR
jgi:3-methyladenine DNA glycosylase AlkC